MRTVFFDVDTQIDFLFPAGALYVPGSERLLPALAKLNRWAAARGIPVVSDVDAHREDDREFRDWPPHCVAGTLGQTKPSSLLLERRAVVPWLRGEFSIEGAQQIVAQKQTLDVFDNPNLPRLLELLNADRYVVYGVVTEHCVRCAAMGLLRTGKPVELVTDAIQALDAAAAERTLEEFVSAPNARLTTVAEIAGE